MGRGKGGEGEGEGEVDRGRGMTGCWVQRRAAQWQLPEH